MRVYGIRHHGPGSARRLKEALDTQQPDCVLIEGPPEGDKLITWLDHKDLQPPVALLLYRPDQPEQAAYYPFAHFSPEWQAMKWALVHRVAVRFIDLSPAYFWKRDEQRIREKHSSQHIPRVDWLGAIAKEGGYEDGERWWEAVIEKEDKDAELIFDALLGLIQAVRENPTWEATVDRDTLLREAYMRREIRRASKKFQNIAVVCGAFHAPALMNLPSEKADSALLKGLKKTKSAATWIPWTYERLALRSGYGAGVTSPAWYDLLFTVAEELRISTWMTQSAQLFRKQGLDASPAHAIEAGRLAYALTALRGGTQPRLEEMLEAVQTVMARGEMAPLQLIEAELIIGQKMGAVPSGVAELPLQQHVKAEQRRLRMRPKAGQAEVKLDLRQTFHREKSYLLHRLDLLDVKWGTVQKISGAIGTFREEWKIDWQPECELALIEAAFWGNTLDKACAARVKQTIKEQNNLPSLTNLLERVFLAGLEAVIPSMIKRLYRLSATDRDPDHLLETLPSLVNVLRYGDVRQLPSTQIRPVIDSLAPRLMLGLPTACRQLDDEFAQHRWEQVLKVHQAIQILRSRATETGEANYSQAWQEALAELASSTSTHSRIAGGALRLLYELGHFDAEYTALAMSRILSPGTPDEVASTWIEGFLHGNGALLIHQPQLWMLLDNWIKGLPEDRFQAALPLLRRTFSRFAAPERRRMGELAKGQHHSPKKSSDVSRHDPARVAVVQDVLKELLGEE